MEIKNCRLYKFLPVVVASAVLIISAGLIAWKGGPRFQAGNGSQQTDTVPKKSGRDFEKELRQLEQGQKKLGELENKDWDKIHRDIEKTLKDIDVEKIVQQAQEAINKVDFNKIQKDIEASLSKIDFEKIQKDIDIENELSTTTRENIRKQVDDALGQVKEQLEKKEWLKELEEVKKVDLKQLNEEMKNVKKELDKVKEELSEEKFNMKETMEKARTAMETAKAELKGYQEMVYAMEKEGLVSTSQDYTIEYKNTELFINGKKQSPEVTARYKKYFRKEPITIKKRDGDLSIDHD